MFCRGYPQDSSTQSPDSLSCSKVFKTSENLKALNEAAGYLRTLLAKRLALRSVPKLQFRYDSSIENGAQLSSLIDSALKADMAQHGDDLSADDNS